MVINMTKDTMMQLYLDDAMMCRTLKETLKLHKDRAYLIYSCIIIMWAS